MWPFGASGGDGDQSGDEAAGGGFGDFISGGAMSSGAQAGLGVAIFLVVLLLAYYAMYLYPATRFDGNWGVTKKEDDAVATTTLTIKAGTAAAGVTPITLTFKPILPVSSFRSRAATATGAVIDGWYTIKLGDSLTTVVIPGTGTPEVPQVLNGDGVVTTPYAPEVADAALGGRPGLAKAATLHFNYFLSSFEVKDSDGKVVANGARIDE